MILLQFLYIGCVFLIGYLAVKTLGIASNRCEIISLSLGLGITLIAFSGFAMAYLLGKNINEDIIFLTCLILILVFYHLKNGKDHTANYGS